MYRLINKTDFPPKEKPVMLWEGKCGFCHYWILRWKRWTDNKIDYEPYEKAAPEFPDIPVKLFKQAIRLIEPNGKVYNGAEAAFRSFTYGTRWGWIYRIYQRSSMFRYISHHVYSWISKHRPFLYKVTVMMWGKNPAHQRPYWLGWFALLLLVIFFIAAIIRSI